MMLRRSFAMYAMLWFATWLAGCASEKTAQLLEQVDAGRLSRDSVTDASSDSVDGGNATDSSRLPDAFVTPMDASADAPLILEDSGPLLPLPAAFPGAEGFGKEAVGGHGGRILRVTTLNDSGPGSLRDACDAYGPRIIVFDVSGTIALADTIKIRNPFVTIAGQTAPGQGIALRDSGLDIRTNDVVVRHLRIRPGNSKSYESQALNIRDAARVMVDHCSFSWSVDENVGFAGTAHDITIQRCLISEGLYNAGHADGHHSAGLISNMNNTNISIHHNVFVHNDERNPRAHGGLLDFRNNLIYNFGSWCGLFGNTGAAIQLNWIGNLVLKGPDTGTKHSIGFAAGEVHVFVQGNIDPYRASGTGDEWDVVDGSKAMHQSLTSFPVASVTTHAVQNLRSILLDNVGATLPQRDSVDERVIDDVRNGTGHRIDMPSDRGGWPTLSQGTVLLDTDGDGMPDAWEISHALNPNLALDGSRDRDQDGYTNVEEYLNSL